MLNQLPELLPSFTAIDTGDVIIEPSLAGKGEVLVSRAGFTGQQLLIVCDTATHKACGQRLASEIASLHPDILILQGAPHADEETVELIRSQPYEALIAVGSGTISDLCKYASFLDKTPYAVFPTAPSMNGYLCANASITIGGHKKSLAAHLPSGVFCDLGVLAAAPRRLILSGLGDCICRPTAQADWLLSHLVLDTPYTSAPFDWLKPYERELFAHAEKLGEGDARLIEFLMKALLVSGLGMVVAGGSYPASQGEHMIAHTMEMKHAGALPQSYHGEQIGVTTLTMARIQQEALSRPLRLTKKSRRESAIETYFGYALAKSVTEASWSKHLLYERYDALNDRLTTKELEIRELIRQVSLPEPQLREVLERAGAKTTAASLGWVERDYELAVYHARFIRDRFTFLDLL